MCGILGIVFSRNKKGAITCEAFNKRLSILHHRGPDSEDVVSKSRAILGHTRLPIIDLVGGKQPMTDDSGRFTVVFNGEIYNYIEIRKELQSLGERFYTASDTEVLLLSYRRWKYECLQRLTGMFAFAIWDDYKQALFLARDRFGKKPLIYAELPDGSFVFGSELKAIAGLPGLEKQINFKALDLYLALGYVPAPFSICQKVKKLIPGHYLVLDGEGKSTLTQYWHPHLIHNKLPLRSEERLVQFDEIFRTAVKIRLRSDVPIGIFLSGGIDSSAVLATAADMISGIKTFTVSFDADRIDMPYARNVANIFGSEHIELEVNTNLKDDIDHIYYFYDEPFFDTSAIPSYYVSKIAANHVRVVLNGDGGDELFGGYSRYSNIGIKQAIKLFAGKLGLKWDSKHPNPAVRYYEGQVVFRRSIRNIIMKSLHVNHYTEMLPVAITANPLLRTEALPNHWIRKAMWSDRHMYLPNNLMFKMDIASNAWSLEARSPLLDHTLAEWSESLPLADIIKGSRRKIILRNYLLKKGVPPKTVHRRKYGFGSPIKSWLKNDLKEAAYSGILDAEWPNALGSPDYLYNIFNGNESISPAQLWSMVVFGWWKRIHGYSF